MIIGVVFFLTSHDKKGGKVRESGKPKSLTGESFMSMDDCVQKWMLQPNTLFHVPLLANTVYIVLQTNKKLYQILFASTFPDSDKSESFALTVFCAAFRMDFDNSAIESVQFFV